MPKPKFDLHSNPWYIRVENEEQFNLANEWLKENFGSRLELEYYTYIKFLTNTTYRGEVRNDLVMWNDFFSAVCSFHEIKFNYKTTIISVECPVVQAPETEQQKRIRELKDTIEFASKQLEELMKETK